MLRGAQQVAIYKFSLVADIVPECHGRRAVGQRAAAQQNVVPGDLFGAVVVTPIPGLSAEVATAIGEHITIVVIVGSTLWCFSRRRNRQRLGAGR